MNTKISTLCILYSKFDNVDKLVCVLDVEKKLLYGKHIGLSLFLLEIHTILKDLYVDICVWFFTVDYKKPLNPNIFLKVI